MEVGQVKSGENKDDTYIRMLQEIMRVTPSVAYGIAAEYPSVIALVHGLRKHGRLALEDLRVCIFFRGISVLLVFFADDRVENSQQERGIG